MVMGDLGRDVDVVVVGGGPGGYSAAFRCAELGLETVVVDEGNRLGGACLYEGCIPSKALLHVAALIGDAERARELGVDFGEPRVSLDTLGKWKSERVIGKLARGLASQAKSKGVDVIAGRAAFETSRELRVEGDEPQRLRFTHGVIATGSRPSRLGGLEIESDRVMDSSAALALADVPERLLVVGGGYIGLELGQVYAALGSRVTLVEMTDGLLPGVDRDLVQPLARRCEKLFAEIHLSTRLQGLRSLGDVLGEIANRGHRDPDTTRAIPLIDEQPVNEAAIMIRNGSRSDRDTQFQHQLRRRTLHGFAPHDGGHGNDRGGGIHERGPDTGHCKDRIDAEKGIGGSNQHGAGIGIENRLDHSRRSLCRRGTFKADCIHDRYAAPFDKVALERQITFVGAEVR